MVVFETSDIIYKMFYLSFTLLKGAEPSYDREIPNLKTHTAGMKKVISDRRIKKGPINRYKKLPYQ